MDRKYHFACVIKAIDDREFFSDSNERRKYKHFCRSLVNSDGVSIRTQNMSVLASQGMVAKNKTNIKIVEKLHLILDDFI